MFDILLDFDVTDSFTLSVLKTKAYSFANSGDPNEMAHNEMAHKDLQCLPLYF